MSDPNAPFKFAGFVVGMDTSTQTLLIRPSNIVVDDTGKKYGVGIINPQQGILIAFENNKSNAIKRLFREKEDPQIPVSLLRRHKNACVIITKEIAQKANIESITITGLSPQEAAECILKK